MSEKKTNRENRRRRRRRNQLISYCVMAVVLIAVGMGCFLGIRAAGSAVKQHQAAQEESRQELLEASRVEESAQAQAAVAALFETESTEETESTYTKEEALNDMVEDTLAGMTLEQKVAGLFFVTPEQLTGVSQVVAAGDATRESLEKYPVGGLIYFAQNIQSENQLKEMLSNTASYSLFPLFFGVDEEGGKVARVADALKLDKTLPMGEIGAAGDTQAAYDAYQNIGGYLSAYGFNVDFAPVADVLTNVDNTVIGNRAFSSDAGVAAQMVSSAVTGLQETGVSACLKHFPGHGDTVEDSHYGTAYVRGMLQELETQEFVPFRAGIRAGADCVMIGHLVVPDISDQPADLSETLVTDCLRNELAFHGLIITDSFQMEAITDHYEPGEAAVLAIRAGVDLILEPEELGETVEGILTALDKGELTEKRIDESVERILMAKQVNGIQIDHKIEKQ